VDLADPVGAEHQPALGVHVTRSRVIVISTKSAFETSTGSPSITPGLPGHLLQP
jgi:hypothetical protein